jgi:hypothetical protein
VSASAERLTIEKYFTDRMENPLFNDSFDGL